MAQELFRIPVRVGVPRGMYGLSDRLFNPAFATSIGLLVWGAKHEQESLPPYRRHRSLLGRFISRLRRFLPQ
jgi:cell division protein FtsA